MSRNPRVDYTQFVHEFLNDNDERRYAVAEWVEQAAQYQWPLDYRIQQLTGCSAGYCGGAEDCDNIYRDRVKALRRARYLFGYQFETL